MVRLCMCVCARAWVCRRRAKTERQEDERGRLSLCFFFSLSPSLLPEGQGFESECIVKKQTNKLKLFFLFFFRRRATCQLLRNQTFKKETRQTCSFFFLDTHFKSRLNQLGFEIQLINIARVDHRRSTYSLFLPSSGSGAAQSSCRWISSRHVTVYKVVAGVWNVLTAPKPSPQRFNWQMKTMSDDWKLLKMLEMATQVTLFTFPTKIKIFKGVWRCFFPQYFTGKVHKTQRKAAMVCLSSSLHLSNPNQGKCFKAAVGRNLKKAKMCQNSQIQSHHYLDLNPRSTEIKIKKKTLL